jgi:FdhD protein
MSDRIKTVEFPEASLELDTARISAGGDARSQSDLVTIEEPLEIRLACLQDGTTVDQSISVTMRTPGADTELALGFLVGEAIIEGPDDVISVDHCGPPSPDKGIRNVIRVNLADHVQVDTGGLLRHFYATSSCGVCGKASLDAVRVQISAPARSDFSIPAAALCALPDRLDAAQVEFPRTGGLHAVAAFDQQGRIVRLREDVGRHNAFDKLAGSYFQEGGLDRCGVLLSGRASFELVQKAAVAGVTLVAAVGPPSSLAVELAEDQHITLVGFLKVDGFNVYSHPDRIESALPSC